MIAPSIVVPKEQAWKNLFAAEWCDYVLVEFFIDELWF